MASDLEHVYNTDGTTTAGDVRAQLRTLTSEELSKKSPINPGGTEAGIEVLDGDNQVVVRIEGHEGEWSRTSEEALRKAVVGVDGVDELTVSKGGYEKSE